MVLQKFKHVHTFTRVDGSLPINTLDYRGKLITLLAITHQLTGTHTHTHRYIYIYMVSSGLTAKSTQLSGAVFFIDLECDGYSVHSQKNSNQGSEGSEKALRDRSIRM